MKIEFKRNAFFALMAIAGYLTGGIFITGNLGWGDLIGLPVTYVIAWMAMCVLDATVIVVRKAIHGTDA